MSDGTEHLLEEYLRVINGKDSEITRLLRENEFLQLELRRKEDRYRSKLVGIKGELERVQKEATSRARTSEEDRALQSRLQTDNESLKTDVVTLRDALKKSDSQLQEVLRHSQKAQKHETHGRERLESEFRQVRTTLEERLFEALQRCGHLEAMASSGGAKASDAEKELVRWKIEAQRLQHEGGELQRALKELKRRCRDMVPKDIAESEALQLEDRHRVETAGLEKECSKLRDQLREESHRAQRLDATTVELRKRCEDVEHEFTLSRRQFEEINVAYTSAKVQHTAFLEDTKKTFTSELRTTREQLEKERYARISLDGELLAMRQRLQDAEATMSQQQTKAIQQHQALSEELQENKHKLQATIMELEVARRRAHTLQEVEQTLRGKCDALRNEFDVETSKLKSELLNAEEVIHRREADNQHANHIIAESRAQIQQLHQEASASKAAAAKREQDIRTAALTFDEQIRKRDDEKRHTVELGEDKVRDVERLLSEERIQHQRELQRLNSASVSHSSDLQERIVRLEDRLKEAENERLILKEEISMRAEKERSLQTTVSQSDERVIKLQLDLTEREVSAQTLHRTLEQTAQALRATQADLEEARQSLAKERNNVGSLEDSLRTAHASLQGKEQELIATRHQCKELERNALSSTSELQRELSALQSRVKQLSLELNSSQQANAALKIDMSRAERSWGDEQLAMRRDIVDPLERRVEQLISTTQRLTSELSDRDDSIHELTKSSTKHQETILFLQSEVSSKDRKLQQATEEVEAGQSQLLSLRRTQQQLASAQDESRRLRLDLESLQEKVQTLEGQLSAKQRELSQMHDREMQLVTEVSHRTSEIATLRERYANLESLKSISDSNFAELQTRERDLLDKIEEMRSTQNMMQMCFDKQQEQIELSRKLRTDTSVHDASHGGTRLQF
ncbi:basal body component, putative [Bodo saltans]|uniref:Basal body component, putative n=1 Tax=Bodo saltans TaxID=75058 RepID=A0A0S4KQM3_BODSA|nr:basal body component, putative [Bodo saltans]|eukprot:CUI15246.1 basal body component, putative [Bodo saltans]